MHQNLSESSLKLNQSHFPGQLETFSFFNPPRKKLSSDSREQKLVQQAAILSSEMLQVERLLRFCGSNVSFAEIFDEENCANFCLPLLNVKVHA